MVAMKVKLCTYIGLDDGRWYVVYEFEAACTLNCLTLQRKLFPVTTDIDDRQTCARFKSILVYTPHDRN